jgi:hypothetical protein
MEQSCNVVASSASRLPGRRFPQRQHLKQETESKLLPIVTSNRSDGRNLVERVEGRKARSLESEDKRQLNSQRRCCCLNAAPAQTNRTERRTPPRPTTLTASSCRPSASRKPASTRACTKDDRLSGAGDRDEREETRRLVVVAVSHVPNKKNRRRGQALSRVNGAAKRSTL